MPLCFYLAGFGAGTPQQEAVPKGQELKICGHGMILAPTNNKNLNCIADSANSSGFLSISLKYCFMEPLPSQVRLIFMRSDLVAGVKRRSEISRKIFYTPGRNSIVPRAAIMGWNAQLNSPPATASTRAKSSNSSIRRGAWEDLREPCLRCMAHPPFRNIICPSLCTRCADCAPGRSVVH